MAVRYFTVDEANALLPQLRTLLQQIDEIRTGVAAHRAEIGRVLRNAPTNGGSKAASEVFVDFGRVERLVSKITQLGCILKDAQHGLIDFPTLRDGREVYLCWRLGEPEVRFWHDVDAGFAGRQPI